MTVAGTPRVQAGDRIRLDFDGLKKPPEVLAATGLNLRTAPTAPYRIFGVGLRWHGITEAEPRLDREHAGWLDWSIRRKTRFCGRLAPQAAPAGPGFCPCYFSDSAIYSRKSDPRAEHDSHFDARSRTRSNISTCAVIASIVEASNGRMSSSNSFVSLRASRCSGGTA